MLRTPIRSPPLKRMNANVTPKKMEFDQAEDSQGWQNSSSWSWWGAGWDWQDWRNDDRDHWRPVRSYSWRCYDVPVEEQLLSRQATQAAIPEEGLQGVKQNGPSMEKALEADLKLIQEGHGGGDDVKASEATDAPKPDQIAGAHELKWRTDKYGVPLSAKALYQRFYRQIRSGWDD